MASVCASLQKPAVRLDARKSFAASRSAPRASVRVMAQNQEQKESFDACIVFVIHELSRGPRIFSSIAHKVFRPGLYPRSLSNYAM